MAAFEYRQAQEIRDTLQRYGFATFLSGSQARFCWGSLTPRRMRFPVCHPDDIIASKLAANRVKDRESLPRLQAFRDYWKARQRRDAD